jgi:hypothetical protein
VATWANLDKRALTGWLERYGKAWEERDTSAVIELFHSDALYYRSPFEIPKMGTEGIERFWTEAKFTQRRGPFRSRILSVTGNQNVAWWSGVFVQLPSTEWMALDGILSARFNAESLCVTFQKWWHSKGIPSAASV